MNSLKIKIQFFLFFTGLLSPILIFAQSYSGKYLEANYNEAKVPEYTLPEVLTSFNGQTINTIKEWEEIRRPEIVKFFEQNIYGE
ncbi:MAG: hypothetical protein R3182_13160, partial [Draconibacterium sp.]|nr:hypothetical protein [Draconibacterium sp.]